MKGSGEIVQLVHAEGLERVGGKALHLGELLRAGFPVPDGFVVTTDAYRNGWSDTLSESIVSTWQEMDSPRVAVRSSATAEDLDGASMAGQYETFLNIDSSDGLIDAIRRCWQSVDTDRTRSYLAGQNLTPDQVAMAVVVQRQVAADVAGVLFTADPAQGGVDEMVVEASWGLGEAVVSGIVQPDLYRLCAKDGTLTSLTVADKQRWIPAGHEEQEQDVPEARRQVACLKTADLRALWKLGRLAETHYGTEQDIEWAIADGKLLMLQARAITTLAPHKARHAILTEAKSRLAKQTGPWASHNLGETLPHPHPLTWSVIHHFMSGDGGFGDMYRQVGFEPGPAVAKDGFLELIAGQIYMDCDRSPEMFFADYPFAYDAELLNANPGAAQDPPTLATGSPRERAKVNKKLLNVAKQIETLAESLADDLHNKTIPEFEAWCAKEKRQALNDLSTDQLVKCWRDREKRVFKELAPQIFLPSLVEGHLQQALRGKLAEICWDRDPETLLQILSVAEKPDATMRSNIQLEEVASGKRTLDDWITSHGHRCPGEFDLAVPRWRERPDDAAKLAEVFTRGGGVKRQHATRQAEAEETYAQLLAICPPGERAAFAQLVVDFQRYLPFREDGKDTIIRGCDLLRDVALEMGARLGVGERVFWLNETELIDALTTGYVPEDILEKRATRFQAEATIELPPIISAEQLSTLGESDPSNLPSGDLLPALAISRGVATGEVCIVHSPESVGKLPDDYVLVCPSTDPSWTPLFVNAVGVVLERGGALSHGAVVAREMGVPAIVLPNATRLLENGQAVSIDGDRGALIRVSAQTPSEDSAKETVDPDDCHFAPTMIPPVAGPQELRTGRWALWATGIWGGFLALVFLLPPKLLHDPLLSAMDTVLWPLVNSLGRPGTLALIAVFMSALLMVLQRVLTDNSRMLAARDRAALLRESTKQLDSDAPRRQEAERLAKPVTMRMLVTAMVPIALVLGPLCMLFTWFPARLAPTAKNAPAGSTVTVVAMVDGESPTPIRLVLDERLSLEAGEMEQTLPPIRSTLEALKRDWKNDTDLSAFPWAVRASALNTRNAMLADLNSYLARGIPAQSVVWTIRAPDDVESRFPITVKTSTDQELYGSIVLGDSIPPQTPAVAGTEKESVPNLRIVYPPSKQRAVFWTPFARLGWQVDFGWLWTYLLAYLPPMFLFKRLLNVA